MMEQGVSHGYEYTKFTMTDEKPGPARATPGRPVTHQKIPTAAGRPTPVFADAKGNSTIPWEEPKAENTVRQDQTKASGNHHHSVMGAVTVPVHLHADLLLHSHLPVPGHDRHCVQSPPQACLVCHDGYCSRVAPGALVRDTWCQKGVGHPDRVHLPPPQLLAGCTGEPRVTCGEQRKAKRGRVLSADLDICFTSEATKAKRCNRRHSDEESPGL